MLYWVIRKLNEAINILVKFCKIENKKVEYVDKVPSSVLKIIVCEQANCMS